MENLETSSAVHQVNHILIDAVTLGASDIHFEPYETEYRIRYRQDGLLYRVATPAMSLMQNIITRIKVLAQMDIAERRVPQDGRFQLALSPDHIVDFRVNTCPTLYGEKMVVRVLNTAHMLFDLDRLGMHPTQKSLFLQAIERPQGLILVCGATGSGKTMTLYAALNHLNTTEKNISTVEDPIEIPLYGINQVPINLRAGLTFATVLRALLRQDPDVMMVGEIRDIETAEMAIKAAQTGHLVLSTLHTKSAPETISRLMNMGIAPVNLASSLTLMVAQRLVRKLCEYCKQKVIYPEVLLLSEGFSKEEITQLTLYGPASCDHCVNGYKGRVGIFEVMPVSHAMAQLILAGGDALALAALATDEKIWDVRIAGLEKVRAGVTSLEEINRVCG